MSRRFTWPWGRISPEKRMEEIDKIIARNKASIKIVEAQAIEAVRLHKKSIEYLLEQKAEVERFVTDVDRKDLLNQAYELEAAGALILDKIKPDTPTNTLRDIVTSAQQELSQKSLEQEAHSPNSDDSQDLDIFGELDGSISEIFGEDET